MRESGPWTYAAVNVLHLLGVAALFGSILVIDLRLLGLGRRVPLASLPTATTPITVTGLVLMQSKCKRTFGHADHGWHCAARQPI